MSNKKGRQSQPRKRGASVKKSATSGNRGGGQSAKKQKTGMFEGTLEGNKRGFAFLIQSDGDIFVPHRSLHGASHGDRVAVKADAEGAEVIKILSRGASELVGTLAKKRGYGLVSPDDDRYFDEIKISVDKMKGAKDGDRVVTKITSYKKEGPEGVITEVLGKSGTAEADILAIIREQGFRERFTEKQLAAAEAAAKREISAEGREDFRGLFTITIDGDDAKDFDDAVSIEKTDNGWRLYVHIADVAEYVAEGSELDREALRRATSVYLPNMTLPMLPEAVSNGCCSLKEGEDRLTLTAVLHFDNSGARTSARLCESVINSNYRTTYRNTARILDGDKEAENIYPDAVDMLKKCAELADLIRAKRVERGSIDFATDEALIKVEGDKVLSIEKYPYLATNGIIEEFMIAANEAVAEIMTNSKMPFVYRTHESPAEEKLEILRALAAKRGIKLASGKIPKHIQDFLARLKGDPSERLLNKIALRCMQKARYKAENLGHFGLAAKYYCHFTSPIRRYPDLLCHRIIKAMLRKEADARFTQKYSTIASERADISTEREIAADKCEQNADDYFKVLFMTDKVGASFDGEISGIANAGVFVALDNTVEGLIPTVSLPPDDYVYDAAAFTLAGRKRSFSVGDKIKVRLSGCSLAKREIYFELTEN